MKKHFGNDQHRINHALQVTNYAEQLIQNSNSSQINKKIIIYAAILHDIGIQRAEKKYGSTAGRYQELEGPPIARKIMNSLAISDDIINSVCQIIAHHHSPGIINTMNFKLLYDADWLVNLPDEYDLTTNEIDITQIIEQVYLTKVGKELAFNLFL